MESQERELAVVPTTADEQQTALFSHDPEEAFLQAEKLVGVVASRCTGPGYLVNIKGKNYPKIEWWTTVSASLGLFPRVVYARRLDRENEIAYEARVEVHRNGQVISSGEAMCSSKEARWSNAEEYAIKSMAITRSSGKAYRIPLSFLAVMAGLEGTPAEEMPADTPHRNSETEMASPGKGSGGTPHRRDNTATPKQLEKLTDLIRDPLVTEDERSRLQLLVQEGVTKVKASEILSYYLGHTILKDGRWVQTDDGVLAPRRALNRTVPAG